LILKVPFVSIFVIELISNQLILQVIGERTQIVIHNIFTIIE